MANDLLKDKEFLSSLILQGLSRREMAKEVGCSPTTLIKWLKKHNIIDLNKGYKNKDELSSLYLDKNLSVSEIAKHYNASPITISKYIDDFKLFKTKKEKNEAACEARKKTCKEKYGVDNVMMLESAKNKAKNTSFSKYGKSHYSKTKDFKQRIVEQNLDKFGVEWTCQIESVKEKRIATTVERYGVDNISKLKKISDKKRATLVSNYGGHDGFVWDIEGLTSKQVSDKFSVPYSTLNYLLRNNIIEPNLKDIESFFSEHNYGKNNLEKFVEENLNIPFFNKKIEVSESKYYKPDFKCGDSLFLNVDGLYWHSELCLPDKKYHLEMRRHFENNKFRILQFREDEIYNKTDIVFSIVNNLLGQSPHRIGARKCSIRNIPSDEAKRFLISNHIKGYKPAKSVGLYHQDELVFILSFKIVKGILKIERMCSKVGHSIAGGFSKLLSYIQKNFKFNNIHYWVDLRYGTGDFLLRHGFVIDKETLGWEWTDFKNTYNRLKCRANMDDRGLSQAEHAAELGWVKIYDAGQRLWVKRN